MKKLYIGNLPYDYTDRTLEELLANYGTVESSAVIMDKYSGRSKGFGFVEMDDEGAKKAVEELNGKEIGGRSLVVNEARPREDNRSNNRRH